MQHGQGSQHSGRKVGAWHRAPAQFFKEHCGIGIGVSLTALNPTLITEVFSESTEAYDRGGKFAHYRKLASLMEYVLIC